MAKKLVQIRTALQDTTLPRGGGPDGREPIGILKDTPVAYSALYMQRREDFYPDSGAMAHPHTFSPERWEHWHPRSWHYIPFNGILREVAQASISAQQLLICLIRWSSNMHRATIRSYTDWSVRNPSDWVLPNF